jgi:hypothetical protein
MDPDIQARLRAEFPKGETWGWQRILSEYSIFWDGNHRRLTDLSDREIFVALIWARVYAGKLGESLKLYFDEEKLWRRHFEPGKKVS